MSISNLTIGAALEPLFAEQRLLRCFMNGFQSLWSRLECCKMAAATDICTWKL